MHSAEYIIMSLLAITLHVCLHFVSARCLGGQVKIGILHQRAPKLRKRKKGMCHKRCALFKVLLWLHGSGF